MTRQEAIAIAEKLVPTFEGHEFRFNDLELITVETADGTEAMQWRASFIDKCDPPHAVIERWWDYYTESDPDPEADETETDETEVTDSEEDGEDAEVIPLVAERED